MALGREQIPRGRPVVSEVSLTPDRIDSGRRVRILAFAYACEPVKGSEPAAGWVFARMLARMADVCVITRGNNREPIEDALPSISEREHLRFEYVDLPAWTRFWKRGARGARTYYFLWQIAALLRAHRLRGELSPDLVWHLTWGNAWFGSLAPLAGSRFVQGPVGGGTGTAVRLWKALGVRGTLFEVARTLARSGARLLNPFARLSWNRAELILVQNPETRSWFPSRHRWKIEIFPHAILEEATSLVRARPVTDDRLPTALYVGRLVPWKGVALALHALALLPGWRFLICGTGRDEARLRRLAKELHVDERTEFLGWLPRHEVRHLMEDANVLLFPSLHDDAPFVVAEALATHLPVVCLDRGGPPVLGATPVPIGSFASTVAALADTARYAGDETAPGYPDMAAHTQRLWSILNERLFAGRLKREATRGQTEEVEE